RQFTQDLSASGNLWDGQLGYEAGASYFKEHGRHDRTQSFPTSDSYVRENQVFANWTSRAVYARLDWWPSFPGRRLQVSAAARYTRDDKQAERFLADIYGTLDNGAATGAVNHLKYNRLNPAFTLSYRWAEGLDTYAQVSTGYKSGGALETADTG